jgi:hypothetical protein
MEPEGSLPHSQKPATCPYLEPINSVHGPQSHFWRIHFNIILSPTPESSKLTLKWPWLTQAPHVPSAESHFPFSLLSLYQRISPGARQLSMFRNKVSFYCKEFLAHPPTSMPEGHPLSTVRDCLFSILAATVHIGGRFSIWNLRTSHAVVSGTQLSWLKGNTTLHKRRITVDFNTHTTYYSTY